MRTTLRAAVMAALLSPAAFAGSSYSNIYFFGDSLTDTGAFGGQAYPNGSGGFIILPADARWTTNNAANHANILAGRLGLTVSVNNADLTVQKTGNNFAQGGAQSVTYATGATLPNSSSTQTAGPGGLDIRDLPQQVQDYLSANGGKANPNAVYFVWSGGNDIPTAAGAGSSNASTVATAAANSLATQIGVLNKAGAKLIIAPNLPSFGNTPAAMYAVIDGATTDESTRNTLKGIVAGVLRSEATPTSASQTALTNKALAALAAALSGGATSGSTFDSRLTQVTDGYNTSKTGLNNLSTLYNTSADGAISATGANVVRANVNALFAEVLANPAAYGIDNVTGPACGTTSSLICTTANVTGSLSYLFADDRHPTPTTHALLGNYFASLLQAPYFAEALANVPAAASSRLGSTLDARARALDHEPRAVGTVGAFSSVTGGKQDVGRNGEQAKGELLTVGVDYQFTPSLSVGMAFTQGKLDTSVGKLGSYDSQHSLMSASANYRSGALWLDGDATLGVADIDTRRVADLGSVKRQETGSTRANHNGLRLTAGYRMQQGHLRTGPFAGVAMQRGHVAAFSEHANQSTSMRFGKQVLDSTVLQAGWELQASLGTITPYLMISMKQEQNDDARMLQSGVFGTQGEFTVSGSQPDRSWAEWQTGATVSLGKGMNGYIQASGSSGQKGGNGTRYNLGLAASF
ncbi:autotransporter domain-containing protein [Vogesella sp. XCS3]|uniref:autotransporter domain-containing protein n=1 Tax=Vogesella sp. XCS3 TaxID=2877939 RepID=UPI001D0AB9D4|nr:autotransporter domain-containing protein [Vogesella sp. XCS3]UDM15508.1 autotransporter domain-containing protein [Vogesella sp. XCS3]